LSVLFQTIAFAATKHKDQTRKNPQRTPYINHPLAVARILAEVGIRDLPTLQAALLHDTLEDPCTSYTDYLWGVLALRASNVYNHYTVCLLLICSLAGNECRVKPEGSEFGQAGGFAVAGVVFNGLRLGGRRTPTPAPQR
jgi:hypothetical protein